eukprot:GEMP01045741.1.p1 GENE.GEMP01045741.1~~GEMP01045741.1.p1  ORF type:complete len:344 (+),score=73.29 GEMP01045741.1:88-1119(+)
MSYAGKAQKEEDKWDPALEPLMKFVVGKKGCTVKQASEVGKKKVDYIRGKDLANLLLKDAHRTARRCHLALAAHLNGMAPETDADIQILGRELLTNGFIQRAAYQPIGGNADSSKKRWPDRLARLPVSQGWDPNGFYIVNYSGHQGMQYFLLSCIIGAVLIGCLFPVWPFWAKIGGWYCLVIFLTFYFAVQLIRMFLFILLWVIGCDFWILPNLNDESLGILDSFRPLQTFSKRRDGVSMLFVRLFLLGFLIIVTKEISRTHSLSDVHDLVTGSYEDIIDWGLHRLTALPGRETDIPSLDYLENLEKEISQMDGEEAKQIDAQEETAESEPKQEEAAEKGEEL